MLQNYLKIAIRNLSRHKVFSFINIFGLALGMTCSILILLWVQDEQSFDQFHTRLPRLYRIIEEQHYPGGEDLIMASTPGPLAEGLKKEFPEITHATSVSWDEQVLLANGERRFKESGNYVSPDFLEMFSFPLLQGDPKTALRQPRSMVITAELAQKYFGTTQAMGKLLKVSNTDSYKITGILAQVPKNSTLEFSFLMPVADYTSTPGKQWLKTWGSNGIRTFVMLRPDATKAGLDPKIEKYLAKFNPDTHIDLFLQPVADMYLKAGFHNSREGEGRIQYVKLFSVVAVFILVIACINFMNLSTARSARRAKEVGVRKVIGAVRAVLFGQFIGEAVLVACMAILVALALTQLFLPVFNELTGKSIRLDYGNPRFLLSLVGIALLTGIFAGSYPALFLSSLKPVAVLKGTLRFSYGVSLFRKGLVVFQFILSALLIISTLVVYQQIDYIRHKNLGLDRENVLYMPLEGDLATHAAAFKTDLARVPGIKGVGAASNNPLMVNSNGGGVEWPGKDPKTDILFSYLWADEGFRETMDIQLVAGRYFSREFGADSTKLVVNEEAVRIMGMKDPIGKKMKIQDKESQIIGVVKNFHVGPMQLAMQPLVIFDSPRNASLVFARVEPGQTAVAVKGLEKLARQYNPHFPAEYHFVDAEYEEMYRSEATIGKLSNYFAGLAIIISCLGLFGLALFTAEQRKKEIGIRKVLGASVGGIVGMLSKDFLKLVLIANVLAWPLAYYLMRNWLQGYAFRVDLGWWIFALAGGATLFIALLTVSFQALRAAVANPVRALRSE